MSRVARGQITVDPEIALVCGRRLKISASISSSEGTRNPPSLRSSFRIAMCSTAFRPGFLPGAENYCSSQNKELLFMSIRYSPTVPPKELHLPQVLSQRSLVRAVILDGSKPTCWPRFASRRYRSPYSETT